MFDFKAAIFDLDGTLFDSMWVWSKIDEEFLAKRNIPVPRDYAEAISGLSFTETARYTIDRFGLLDSPDDLIREWNNMAINEYSHNIGLKPFAKEYLLKLKERGILISTATSQHPELSVPAMKNNGIYDLFDAFCNSDEVNRGKDHPDIFLLAAKKLGVSPSDCIVFEDLLPGILSAKKADMTAICIHDASSAYLENQIRDVADGYLYDFENAPLPLN